MSSAACTEGLDDQLYYVGQSPLYLTFYEFTAQYGSTTCTDVDFNFFTEVEGYDETPDFIEVDSGSRIV